eukprot:4200262-Pleurochrysis_carterae.AAC.1
MSSGANMNRLASSGVRGAKRDGVLWTGLAVVAADGAEPACDCDRVVGAEAAVAGATLGALNVGTRGERSS